MSKSAIALATAGGDPVITERAVITGRSNFLVLSPLQTAITTHLSFARPTCAALLILPSAHPAEGAGGAPRRRIQRSRLRGASTTLTRRVSHRFQTGAPASRRSTWRFRLRVPHFRGPPLLLRDRASSPATATGRSSRGCSPPGRKLPGSAPEPPPATTFHRGSQRTPSPLRLQVSPLEDAPSNERGRCGL